MFVSLRLAGIVAAFLLVCLFLCLFFYFARGWEHQNTWRNRNTLFSRGRNFRCFAILTDTIVFTSDLTLLTYNLATVKSSSSFPVQSTLGFYEDTNKRAAVALTQIFAHKNPAVHIILEVMRTAYAGLGLNTSQLTTRGKRSHKAREYCGRKARIVHEQHFNSSLNRLIVVKCFWNAVFVSLFRGYAFPNFCTRISRSLAYGIRISPKAIATAEKGFVHLCRLSSTSNERTRNGLPMKFIWVLHWRRKYLDLSGASSDGIANFSLKSIGQVSQNTTGWKVKRGKSGGQENTVREGIKWNNRRTCGWYGMEWMKKWMEKRTDG